MITKGVGHNVTGPLINKRPLWKGHVEGQCVCGGPGLSTNPNVKSWVGLLCASLVHLLC